MGNNEAALRALLDGTVAAALVWGPAAWALQRSDAAYAGLRLIPTDPLPTSTLGVGATMVANETFLRTNIDQAIASLLRTWNCFGGSSKRLACACDAAPTTMRDSSSCVGPTNRLSSVLAVY